MAEQRTKPCRYCGTSLLNRDDGDADVEAASGRYHYAETCREYTAFALRGIAASRAALRAALEKQRGHLQAIRVFAKNGSQAWEQANDAIADIDAALRERGDEGGGGKE